VTRVARAPRDGRIRRASLVWALAAAIGAAYFVVGFALAVRELALPFARDLEMALTNRTIYFEGIPDSILLALSLGSGAAVGGFVARRAGGLPAVAAFAGLFGGAAVLGVVDAIGREQRLRTSQCCVVATVGDVPLAAAAMFAPALLGVGIAALLARARGSGQGTNALLEAAGTYAVVGGIAALALSPYAWFVLAPYLTVGLEPVPHALTLILQVVVAATVYLLRAGTFGPGAAGVFALMGLAGVAYFDLLEIWFTLFLDHHYVPVSLVVVPAASAALAAALILTGGILRRRVFARTTPAR
jgi:hypothetical protein